MRIKYSSYEKYIGKELFRSHDIIEVNNIEFNKNDTRIKINLKEIIFFIKNRKEEISTKLLKDGYIDLSDCPITIYNYNNDGTIYSKFEINHRIFNEW